MRNTLIAVPLLLALAGGAGAQQAPGRGMGPPLDDENFRPTISMLTSMLQLTPDQVAKITPLRDTLLVTTRAQRQEAAAISAAMRSARRGGAGADSIAALRQRMQAAMLGLMPARMQFHAGIRPFLTPDQAMILDQRQQEMMGTMSERMKQPGPP